MSQQRGCLCSNDDAGCADCAARAREAWLAYSAARPGAAPGLLIEEAVREGLAEVVLGVAQNTGVDINERCDPSRHDSVSPLMTALRAGDARLVRLISRLPGFDLSRSLPEYERWSWARSSSLEVLRQYLAIPGSDVNQPDGNGKTLLHEVVYDLGSPGKLEELLSRPGVAVDARQSDGTTPLYRAALAGNAPAFAALLARGADPNNRNEDNLWTILICAAAFDRADIAEQLLRRPEVEVNAADDQADTALHVAAERGHARIVGLLLRRPDLRVNLKNRAGQTALSRAAFAGHAEVLRLLLARPELEVNFVDGYRQTPLFQAASAGNLEAVRLLLSDPRVNAAVTDRPARHTALDMAEALGFEEIAELLRRREGGADELSPGDDYVERTHGPRPVEFIRAREE